MKRWVLVALVSTLAFATLAVFSLLAPPPTRPVKPTELEPETARERALPAHFDEPVRPAQPPPAPEVANDPARGVVWLRVIDDDTNMPLARAKCELCEIETTLGKQPASEFFWREAVTLSSEARDFESTDENGLLAFKVATDKVTFFGRVRFGAKLEWKYPLPPAFEPVTHPDAAAAAITALQATPAAKPIDIHVRAAPRVHGRVWDPEGRPAAGAEVFAWPLEVAPELDALARCVSEHYEQIQNWRSSGPDQDKAGTVASRLAMLFGAGVGPATPFVGVIKDPLFEVSNLTGPFTARTDRNGRYHLPPVLRGRWMMCAWVKGVSHAVTDCRLVSTICEVDFALSTGKRPALRVSLAYHGPAPMPEFTVWVQRRSPSGAPVFWGSFERTGTIDPESMAAEFPELPPGHYSVRVTDWEGEGKWDDPTKWVDGALVQVLPGTPASVVLSAGAPLGEWIPRVLLKGQALKQVQVMIRGGPYTEPSLVSHEDLPIWGKEPKGVRLPAGVYTAWLPEAKPQTFSVRAGVSSSGAAQSPAETAWNLPAASASFTLEEEFAKRVMDGVKEATLLIAPTGDLPSIRGSIHRQAIRPTSDENMVTLKPGVETVLTLLTGEYHWMLPFVQGSYLEGTLSVTSGQRHHFRFGFNNMPGLARLDIDMLEYVKEGAAIPSIRIAAADDGRLVFEAPPQGYDGEDIPEVRPVALVPVLHEREGWYTAFAKPGVYEISVGERSVRTRIPAMVELKPGLGTAEVEFSWTAGDKESLYRVHVIDSSGCPRSAGKGATTSLKRGRAELFATKWSFDNARGATAKHCARHTLVLDKATVLDLGALSWVAYGRFTLTCEDPGGSTDVWWSDREGWRKVRIISSDSDQVFGEVEVELEAVSDWMPEGRMAFTFKNRSLPPGRYKVIPWPGAPEKFCRTFEVRSGQHTDVVVRGG